MPDPSTPKDDASLRTSWGGEVRARLASLRLSPGREAEIVDELSQHLDDHWRELIAGGASDDEATRLTLAEFRSGNLLAQYLAPLRQSHAAPSPAPGASTGHVLTDLWQDARDRRKQCDLQRRPWGGGRLLHQLLTEAVLLGMIGGAAGLALASAGTQTLVAAQPADIPRLEEIRLNRPVVLFTFAIALLASLGFGALPALQATGYRLTRGVRPGSRGGGADRQSQRARAALVVAEIALAVVLLTGAGLLLRSFVALTRVDPAFVAEHAVVFRVALFGRGYDQHKIRTRVTEFEREVRALPGVTTAAATSLLPLSGPGPRLAFGVEGAPPLAPDRNPEIGVASVTPDYFRTIGTPLIRVRGFTDRDHGEAPGVAIINNAAVQLWFPEGSPIGRRVHMNGVREIVGVIADVLQGHPQQQTAPQLFVPYAQRPARSV